MIFHNDERRIVRRILDSAENADLFVCFANISSKTATPRWKRCLILDYDEAFLDAGTDAATIYRFSRFNNETSEFDTIGTVTITHGTGAECVTAYDDAPQMRAILKKALTLADHIAFTARHGRGKKCP